jgi:hypothetical protein
VWPAAQFGVIDHQRWSGKNRIEADKRRKLAAAGSPDANLRKGKRRLSAWLDGSAKRRLGVDMHVLEADEEKGEREG